MPAASENGPGTWKTSRFWNVRFLLLVLVLLASVAGCQKLVTEKPAAPGVMEPEVFLRGTEEALKRQDNARAITLYELIGATPEVLKEAEVATRLGPKVPRILFGVGNLEGPVDAKQSSEQIKTEAKSDECEI